MSIPGMDDTAAAGLVVGCIPGPDASLLGRLGMRYCSADMSPRRRHREWLVRVSVKHLSLGAVPAESVPSTVIDPPLAAVSAVVVDSQV